MTMTFYDLTCLTLSLKFLAFSIDFSYLVKFDHMVYNPFVFVVLLGARFTYRNSMRREKGL